jgi:drug/metabolite transporter (DMT)-like permease
VGKNRTSRNLDILEAYLGNDYMIWFLWGIIAAILLALVGVFVRFNPWQQGIWGLLLVTCLPIMIGNVSIFKYFIYAPNFTVAFFLFTAIYSASGFLFGLFIFRDQVTFVNLAGILMIIGGSVLLRR